MKNLFILPFFFLVSSFTSGQQNEHPFSYLYSVNQLTEEASNLENDPENWHKTKRLLNNQRAEFISSTRFPGIKAQILDSLNFYSYADNSADLTRLEQQAFTFDEKGNLLTAIIFQTKDSLNERLLPILRLDFIYSRDDRLICETWSLADTMSIWHQIYMSELFYEKGNKSAEYEYYYNEMTHNWYKTWKTNYYYFGPEKMSREESSNWNPENNCWEPNMKYEYVYTANDKLWKENVFHWDSYYSDWDLIWFFESSYDSKELLTEYKYVIVDPENNNNLFTDWKYTYSYFPDEELKEMVYVEWDYDLLEFREQWKENYNYDAFNNLEFFTSFYKSPDDLSWIPSYSYNYWYDTEYSRNNLILPFVLLEDEMSEMMFRSKLTNLQVFEWNTLAGSWQNAGLYTLFYSEKSPTGITENDFNLSIYPNPANDFIYIEGPAGQGYEYMITDMLGNKLLEAELNPIRNGIDLSSLHSGSYFLILSDKQHILQAAKIVVQH